MDTSLLRRRALTVNLWVQTIGIVAAGAWALYAFVFKEIRAPRVAPVNVSVDLELKGVEPSHLSRGSRAASVLAVQTRVGARNPSTREVWLLPGVLVVWGHIMEPRVLSLEGLPLAHDAPSDVVEGHARMVRRE